MNKQEKAAEAAKADEEVIDVTGDGATAVAEASRTAVAAPVAVQGVQLDFPFIRLGQGMSAWKTAGGKKPQIGSFYVGKNKENNVLVAGEGRESGINGILLDVVQGFKERRKWAAGMGAPRRWIVGSVKEDGSRATEADALAAAASEGYSLALKPTGEVWPDTGRPKMAANLDRFCYAYLLVPVPEEFDSDEFRLVPIGDRLYTTARFEFEKQYYKSAMAVLQNVESRARFAHRHEKDYQFSVRGLAVHLYSTSMTNKDGVEYVGPAFERALRDGRPWEFTPEEKADFARFLLSAKAGYADDGGASDDGEFA